MAYEERFLDVFLNAVFVVIERLANLISSHRPHSNNNWLKVSKGCGQNVVMTRYGHPLADAIDTLPNRTAVRKSLVFIVSVCLQFLSKDTSSLDDKRVVTLAGARRKLLWGQKV